MRFVSSVDQKQKQLNTWYASVKLGDLRIIYSGKPVLDTHEVTAKALEDVVSFTNTIDDLLGFP